MNNLDGELTHWHAFQIFLYLTSKFLNSKLAANANDFLSCDILFVEGNC